MPVAEGPGSGFGTGSVPDGIMGAGRDGQIILHMVSFASTSITGYHRMPTTEVTLIQPDDFHLLPGCDLIKVSPPVDQRSNGSDFPLLVQVGQVDVSDHDRF